MRQGPRWRIREIRPHEWWATDESSGTAFEVEASAGERLWRSHDLLGSPLPAAIRAGRKEAVTHFVDLCFAGTTVRYMSPEPAVVDAVASSFAGARATLRSSPDLLVDIAPHADVERLHRAVDDFRHGVRLRIPWQPDWAPGAGELPVLPPVQLGTLAERFCGLHAALLALPNGNVVVCGARRSGKTTTVIAARQLGIASVLADELVLLDRAGAACGVPLPVRERTGRERSSRSLSPTRHGAELVAVRRIVVIKTALDRTSQHCVPDVAEAIRAVAPHLRSLGGELGATTGNVLEALRRTPVWRWCLRPWPALLDDVTAALRDLESEWHR